jgi:hypothetical protein
MRSSMRRVPGARQGGWVGLLVVLVALVIVAVLARDALKHYGLLPGKAAAIRAGTPGERARAPGASGIESLDLEAAPSAPASALDRARGVEDMVKRQAEERGARMDSVAK